MTHQKDGLSELAGEPERVDSTIDPGVVARAESIIAAFGGKYLDWLRGDLGQLDTFLSQALVRLRAIDDLRRKTHNIYSQGGGFGFLMISQVADAMRILSEAQDGFLHAEGETTGREFLALMRRIFEDQGNENAALVAKAERVADRVLLEYGDA